ncbi:MAG: HD domain-containing protein, partial [Halanaerobiaceae bacterium]
GLRLNEDLTEAIALGHDLGHTPFGHSGEEALSEVSKSGFAHNRHSLRVVDHLEKRAGKKKGLNLTREVRDGILNHTGENLPFTLEGKIVRIADRIAYINHDIDDALRAGIIKKKDLPVESINILGETHSQRIDTMVKDLINSSRNSDDISRSDDVAAATTALREFLFAKVYIGSLAKKEEDKAKMLIKNLFQYYLEHREEIPMEFKLKEKDTDTEQLVIDYIAGMTDRYALNRGKDLFLPTPWFGKNN